MNLGEVRLCQFYLGFMDWKSFFGFLFQAIAKADDENRARLKKAFPEEVEAHGRYKTEDGYWERLKEEFHKGGKP